MTPPLRALYAAAVALALVGVWLRLTGSPLPRADAAALVLPPATASAAVPSGGPPRDYAAIVAANIFAQARTPPQVRFTPAGLASARAAVPAAPRGPRLRLYGTTVGPQGAVALIDADPKIPGAETYRLGDRVAGAQLIAITDSTVTLAEPSGPLVLHLQSGSRRRP